MARKVFISSGMSSDDKLLEVGGKDQQAVLIWPWILLTFDDWGRAEANAKVLKARIFPSLDSLSAEDIERALILFGEKGLVELYEVSGRRYMRIPEERWYRYQTHMNRTNRRPGKDKMESDFPIPEDISSNAPQTPTGNHGAPQFPVPSLSPSPSNDQQQQQRACAREVNSDSPPELTDETPARRDPKAFQTIHKCLEESFGRLPSEFQVGTFVLYALDDGMEIDLIVRAIRQSALAQKDLRHADATLKSWRQKGILTNAAAESEAEEFRKKKRPIEQGTRNSQHQRASPSSRRVVPAVQAGKYDEFYRRYSELGVELQGGKPDG